MPATGLAPNPRAVSGETEANQPRPRGKGSDVERRDNILQTIASHARSRVARLREEGRAEAVIARAEALAADQGAPTFPFEHALATPGMSFICECKRASPSRGLIAPDYDPVRIARDYEAAGAAAVSCLTEPRWFQGSDQHLADIAAGVSIPVLRKDFVVDVLMVDEAKAMGADAVLLICSILDDDLLARCMRRADELGISALVEAYEPDEVPRAIAAGARVVGVNNRDLRTFSVDFGRSIELRPLVGEDRIFVSESGVETREDVARLEEAGIDAVLIGETLMRAADRRAALDGLRGGRADG